MLERNKVAHDRLHHLLGALLDQPVPGVQLDMPVGPGDEPGLLLSDRGTREDLEIAAAEHGEDGGPPM